MAFSVKLPTFPGAQYARSADPYRDEDEYQFEDHGILRVFEPKTNTTTYYAPGAWESIQTRDDHFPGGPKQSVVDTIH
ncbi:hypothetical protein AB4Z39_12835 [Mycobacterium adipatum]|uniref:hypothetical protein n=1 Tax=Mycobacterium adipatum TaxID=1682113 RepID=UPI0034E06548